MRGKILLLVCASVIAVAGCSVSTDVHRDPSASLAGTWAISDTFGLSGTITLADVDGRAGSLDTIYRWLQAYQDTIQIVAYALGSGSVSFKGAPRDGRYCGAMIYRQWLWPAYGVATDTMSAVRFQCGGIDFSATPSRVPTGQPNSFQLEISDVDYRVGLGDTTRSCREFQDCSSPYLHSSVTLVKQ